MSSSSLNGQSNTKGMPTGIPFIIGNEAAERFSFYGMKAILTVFMVKYLNMSDSNATEWYHNFNSAVYALPLLGALLSDLFIGKYRTILYLSVVYCFGHLVLALNETQEGLKWGLILIAMGSGGIKPCVSAHVGDQFSDSNKHLVSKVFGYFYFAVNFGSFFSYLLIPTLLETHGPELAFGLPGVLMMIATVVFWLGRNTFVHVQPKPAEIKKVLETSEFWRLIGRLAIVYLFVGVFWSLFDQTGSAWVLQASSDLMDKQIQFLGFDFEILPSTVQSANPVIVMILVPLFTFVIYPALGTKFTPLKRICLGMFFAASSFFVIAYAENFIYEGENASIVWQLLAYILLTIGEVMVSVTALEYAYTQAPPSVKSIIMSLYLLSVSFGNQITSVVNKYMIEDYKVDNIELSEHLIIKPVEKMGLHSGDKININIDLGLIEDKEYKEDEKLKNLQGTYLLGESGDNKFVIWNTNREPVKVKLRKGVDQMTMSGENRFSYYKLNGPAYFNLFAWMMSITALLFIPFAIKLKDRAYLQSHNE